jgi:signal transduction histidine kinase
VDARAQSALLLAIVTSALAVAMVLRPARSRLFTLFAFLNANLCLWAISLFWRHLSVDSVLAARLELVSEAALPAFALAFFMEFLGDVGAGVRRTLRTAVTIAIGALLLSATQVVTMVPTGWRASPVLIAVAVYSLAMVALVASLLFARMRRSTSRTERARLLYLCVGAAATVALVGVESVFMFFDTPFPPIGTVALAVYMYFLSQTLLRHRLLDLNELLGKIVVLSLLALLLAAIYGLLVSWSLQSWSTGIGPFIFNTLVASFVILILVDPIRSKVEGAVVSFLFRERWEFLRTLQQLKLRMASVIEIRDLGQSLLETLHETRRVTHASLYLLSDDGLGFRRVDFRGPPPAAYLDAATARGLVSAAASGQKALLIENVERRLFELRSLLPRATEGSETPAAPASDEALRLSEIGAALAAMRSGVCIPLLGGDRVMGFLNVHDDRVPEAFASDEIALMLEVGEQAAITVENSRLYEKMKERDRLAALGEMAAGLAHEIRNPLSSIKGAVQFLDPKSLPAAEAEIMTVIVEEVNRLNTVVTEFLEYSRPLRSAFTAVSINDVLTKTMKLLQGHEMPADIDVALDLAGELPQIRCDADQLKQVFINLALNAAQAMPKGGTLSITTRQPRASEWRFQDEVPRAIGDQVEIRFADTGEGIPEDVRSHIFVPFYTTKKKGTGLGLAICQRIVKNHGGTIEVESKSGGGTKFILRLPTNAEKPLLDGTPLPAIKPTMAQEIDGTPVPEIRPVAAGG